MKDWLSVALGILTATGGFVDVGAIATAGAAGSVFGLGLVWAMVLGTVAIMVLVEMSGRLTAVSGKPYAAAIRERFGARFYFVPLTSELVANSFMLAADLGGIAIAISLFTGIDWHLLLPVAAVAIFVIVWRAPFAVIENGPACRGHGGNRQDGSDHRGTSSGSSVKGWPRASGARTRSRWTPGRHRLRCPAPMAFSGTVSQPRSPLDYTGFSAVTTL